MKKTSDLAFDRFWEKYPRKVGKLAALKAWTAALKIASADEIIAGVDSYMASKPDYADWCHPRTFLSQGRWMDEPDTNRSAHELSPKTARTLRGAMEFIKGGNRGAA